MFKEEIITLVTTNLHLVAISCFGGLVLFCFKISEYINRAPEDKMTPLRAFVTYAVLFVWLPFLGAAISAIYIVNGDKMSAILSFQVGLTSPAIVHGMIMAAADRAANDPVKIAPGA